MIAHLRSAAPDSTLSDALGGSTGLGALRLEAMATIGPHAADLIDPSGSVGDVIDQLDAAAQNSAAHQASGWAWSRVCLRPIADSDIEDLYQAALSTEGSFRWRFRGTTPSRDSFYNALFDGTLAQFVVVGRSDDERYGLVAAYSALLDQGHTYIAFQRCSRRPAASEVTEGMAQFIDYLFETFPLRKLYAEIPAYNEELLGVAELPMFQREGQLTKHDYHAGRWWDRYLVAVWRDAWESFAAPLTGKLPPSR